MPIPATIISSISAISSRDVEFMTAAIAEAKRALDLNEVPVGAVVVRDGEIIGRGFNRPIGTTDPTAHAELLAIREASAFAGNYRLANSVLYATIEPCLMCYGASVHARVSTIANDDRPDTLIEID